jgi:hypothetical protein
MDKVAELEVRVRKLEDDLALSQRVIRQLLDIEEIRTLRLKYHEAVSEGQSFKIAPLFVEDGEFDFGFMSRGKNIKQYFDFASVRSTFFKQYIHNHQVIVTGDTASGSSYQEAVSVVNGRTFSIAGRYDDIYQRTEQGWRFKKITFDPYIMLPSPMQDIANPETRKVDPYKGFIQRDANGNLIVPNEVRR